MKLLYVFLFIITGISLSAQESQIYKCDVESQGGHDLTSYQNSYDKNRIWFKIDTIKASNSGKATVQLLYRKKNFNINYRIANGSFTRETQNSNFSILIWSDLFVQAIYPDYTVRNCIEYFQSEENFDSGSTLFNTEGEIKTMGFSSKFNYKIATSFENELIPKIEIQLKGENITSAFTTITYHKIILNRTDKAKDIRKLRN